MKAGVKGDSARIEAARKVIDFVGDGVPCSMVLFCGCLFWGLDGMAFCDQRVEIDHAEVVVERFEDGLARYAGGNGGYCREEGSFRHSGKVASDVSCAIRINESSDGQSRLRKVVCICRSNMLIISDNGQK